MLYYVVLICVSRVQLYSVVIMLYIILHDVSVALSRTVIRFDVLCCVALCCVIGVVSCRDVM